MPKVSEKGKDERKRCLTLRRKTSKKKVKQKQKTKRGKHDIHRIFNVDNFYLCHSSFYHHHHQDETTKNSLSQCESKEESNLRVNE